MRIEVKDTDVLKNLIDRKWHPMLVDIVLWIAENYGLCFTEGWRPARHKGDVHDTDPLRAVDLRHWIYPDEIIQEIEHAGNQRWIYDPTRPKMKCIILHSVGSGFHFHVQVHPNTVTNG